MSKQKSFSFLLALIAFSLLSEPSVVAGNCRDAVRFYNQAIAVGDLTQKDRLFIRALKAPCMDKEIVAKIHNNLADTYEKQGRIEKAIAEYYKASKADPSLPTPYLSLGDIYTRLNRPRDANRFY